MPQTPKLTRNSEMSARIRVGDTVAYWWTKDPNQGTPVFGGMDQVDDFSAPDLLVGLAASAAVDDGSQDDGFQFAHFSLVPLAD